MTLNESDHLDWLALLRVRSRHVSKHGDHYAYRGQLYPPVSLVAVALRGLAQAGLLTLADPDEHGLAPVALTEAGLARYQALTRRQRARPDP